MQICQPVHFQNRAERLINQLAAVYVEGENGIKIPLLDTLKAMPRSGKAVRIQKYHLALPKRSVFDHILALPYQARLLSSLSHINLDGDRLINLLIFHDLSEALIGDSPSFTPYQLAKETFMSSEAKEKAEQKANEKIFAALPMELKKSFLDHLKIISEKNSDLYRFFYMVDKTDPIIAIWRYIACFRKEMNLDTYLEAMSDFFLFPEAQRSCIHADVLSLVRHLQNKDNAKNYYLKGEEHFHYLGDKIIAKPLQELIEGRSMHMIS